jgi:hypothetical protein
MTHKTLKNKPLVEAHVRLSGQFPGAGASGIKTGSLQQDGSSRFYARSLNQYLSTRHWRPPSFLRRWFTTRPSTCFEWGEPLAGDSDGAWHSFCSCARRIRVE